jgi:hypothetical protein
MLLLETKRVDQCASDSPTTALAVNVFSMRPEMYADPIAANLDGIRPEHCFNHVGFFREQSSIEGARRLGIKPPVSLLRDGAWLPRGAY